MLPYNSFSQGTGEARSMELPTGSDKKLGANPVPVAVGPGKWQSSRTESLSDNNCSTSSNYQWKTPSAGLTGELNFYPNSTVVRPCNQHPIFTPYSDMSRAEWSGTPTPTWTCAVHITEVTAF